MRYLKFVGLFSLIWILHAIGTWGVVFLIDLDSFPYGVHRSQGSWYLEALRLANWLFGLPLQWNSWGWPMLINSAVNSLLFTSLFTVYQRAIAPRQVADDTPLRASNFDKPYEPPRAPSDAQLQ